MRKLVAAIAIVMVITLAAFVLWPRARTGLVLYSALDYGPAVAQAFTARTGIPVRVIRLPTGGLLARITAEGHHPDWDLAWFDGATAAVSLDRAGLLAHGLPAPAGLTAFGRTLTSPDGAFVPTGFTLAGVFVLPAAAPHPLPTGWSDLGGPRFAGLVGMNDPSISGPTYPALAGMLQNSGGWPAGQEYVTALKRNGLHVFAKNDATLAALRGGAIGLAIVQSSAAIHAARAPGSGLQVVFPRPAYVLPNVIVLPHGLRGAARAAALRFVAFANTAAVQTLREQKGEGDGFYWPVTATPAPRPALPALAGLDLATLDAASWGARENAVVAWFARTIVGTGQ